MAHYLIGKFDIIDQHRFDEYVEKVRPLLDKYHGTVIVGNDAATGLEGPRPGMNVVIEFRSESDAAAFWNDPAYQPIKDIRLAATTNHTMVSSPRFQF